MGKTLPLISQVVYTINSHNLHYTHIIYTIHAHTHATHTHLHMVGHIQLYTCRHIHKKIYFE